MIRIRDLYVNLGAFQLQNVNLEVEKGEYFIILGPTGAGKTLLLESVAGLHPVFRGSILVDDKEVTHLKPEKRGIAMVYQEQALFPHLSVKENIAFGLKAMKFPKDKIEARVKNMAEIIGITGLLQRKPDTLSGGEKQKVALSRAMVTDPAVILLDEPISAMDPETREYMQQELARIHHNLGATIIHVTHNFDEAISLGHRVAVLNEGSIVQTGTPEDVVRRPNSEFVARFALSRNIYTGNAQDAGDGYSIVNINGTEFTALSDLRGEVHLSIRPEDIIISREPFRSTARNAFEGIITGIIHRGDVIYLTVDVPPDFVCLITRRSSEDLELNLGLKVWITFKVTAIHVF